VILEVRFLPRLSVRLIIKRWKNGERKKQHISLPTLYWQSGWLPAESMRSRVGNIAGEEIFLFTIRIHLVLR
jgi:hypothetical protein